MTGANTLAIIQRTLSSNDLLLPRSRRELFGWLGLFECGKHQDETMNQEEALGPPSAARSTLSENGLKR